MKVVRAMFWATVGVVAVAGMCLLVVTVAAVAVVLLAMAFSLEPPYRDWAALGLLAFAVWVAMVMGYMSNPENN